MPCRAASQLLLAVLLLLPLAATAGQATHDCRQFTENSKSSGSALTLEELDGARRILLPLEFAPGESELDARASLALTRLLSCSDAIGLGSGGLLVIGFATPAESHGLPLQSLAHERADAVARRLRKAGIVPQALRGAQTDSTVKAAHVELWLRD